MESILALLGLLLFIAPVVSLVLGLSQRGRLAQLEEQLRRQQEQLRAQQDHLRVLGDELRALRSGQGGLAREAQPAAPPLPEPARPPEAQPEPAQSSPEAVASQGLPPPPPPDPALGRPQAAPPGPTSEPGPVFSTPRPPAGPPRPNWLREFVTGPGGFARLGAVMLLIGVGFLLKYASDAGWIGLPFRLGVIVVGALGLFGFGWRLRHSRPGYSVALQGTAFGVLYLTIFAAFRLYGLLPPTPAFGLLAGLGAAMCLLSVRQEAQVLAGLGVLGAFLAPVLANGGSGGGGGPAALFGYYLLVNAGVFALAWWRDWRPLYLLGFVSTFVVGTGWGVLAYTPGQFAATEPFLLLFTLLYAAIPVLEAWRGRREGGAIQSVLLFGTPAVFLALQAGLLSAARAGMALSALGVALAYGLVAVWLQRRRAAPLLWHGHAAVSAAALTLAVPFALGQDAYLGAWALLGAGLAWFGGRGRWRGWTAAGLGLSGLTAALYLTDLGVNAVFSGVLGPLPALLNGLIIGAAGVLAAWAAGPLGRGWTLAPGGLGVALWLLAGGVYIQDRTNPADAWTALFVAGSGALAAGLWPRLRVEALRWSAWLPLVAALVLAGARLSTSAGSWWPDPLLRLGWLAFPLALAAGWWAVRQAKVEPKWPDRLSAWLAVVLAAAWLSVRVLGLGEPWPQVALLAVPLAGFLAYTLGFVRDARSQATWRGTWLPVLGVALLWPVLSAGLSGRAGSGVFLPLLNPVDLASLAVLVAAWASLTRAGARRLPGVQAAFAPVRERLPARTVPRLLGGLSIFALSLAVVRAAGNLSGVPYDLGALFASSEVQVVLTVTWAVTGLAGMVWASRRAVREVWLIGAALLGASAVKLFLIDLGGVSAPARIVSFLAVGALFLLVGYLSPAPPSEGEAGKAA